MKKKIEEAIKSTLVVENKESIKYAIDKIFNIIEPNINIINKCKKIISEHFSKDDKDNMLLLLGLLEELEKQNQLTTK